MASSASCTNTSPPTATATVALLSVAASINPALNNLLTLALSDMQRGTMVECTLVHTIAAVPAASGGGGSAAALGPGHMAPIATRTYGH